MVNNEFLRETLEHYKQQKQAKIEEIRLLNITIHQLQVDLGEPVDPGDLVFAGGSVSDARPFASTTSKVNHKPRVDEFFNMSIAEAARTYLEKIGHAVSAEEILKAITGGGCKVGGADPKRTLSITLGQGKREFVSMGGGNYGLRKFYPNMPKLGRPEGSTPTKTKAKRKAKKSKRESKYQPYDPTVLRAAINEALSDHKAKTADEVLAVVEKRIGHSVKKIAVYGTLRKKDFEQVGDKYRLRQEDNGMKPEIVQ